MKSVFIGMVAPAVIILIWWALVASGVFPEVSSAVVVVAARCGLPHAVIRVRIEIEKSLSDVLSGVFTVPPRLEF